MQDTNGKKSLWVTYGQWVSSHSKITLGVALGLFCLGTAVFVGAFFAPVPAKPAVEAPIIEVAFSPAAPAKFYSPLTSLEVKDEATVKRLVTAIMIENSPDARPQSGLKDAGIVFEAIAEGGITRFLALYQEARPGLIGPVRSLRPYYVDWLAPFDPAVAHIGGSANALKEIRNGQYKDIDQFFNAGAYWRASDRYAPHNVYTNSDRLDDLNKSKGFTTSNFTPWPRKFESPSKAPSATKINIDVSSPTFDVRYDYDQASNSYIRSHGTGKHTDREAGQLTPKTVIVMNVPTHRGFEDGYREQMDTVGTNKAYIFQNGTVVEGLWHKPDRKGQIRFYDQLGRPIPLNAGQTWITVISTEKEVTW